ncbi:hypothetical protein KAR91_82890 [Candidatus Pacearchaeota archaeon]|nr:hypothetical protein [Candidatus Pacearchaeota archaeon]
MAKVKAKKVKKKSRGGAPTKYREKYCEEIIEYFSGKPYRTVKGIDKANDFPSYAGFSGKIGVSRETLHEWKRTHPKFSDAYRKCKQLQEHFLMTNGLKGLYNGPFAIFTAKNVIGWTDKQDLTNSDQSLKSETKVVVLPENGRKQK